MSKSQKSWNKNIQYIHSPLKDIELKTNKTVKLGINNTGLNQRAMNTISRQDRS